MTDQWRDAALCAQTDLDAFFPDANRSAAPAKRICAACPVVAECLAYALATSQAYGVWGGMSVRERAALKRAEGGVAA
jgi:WhiB family redox-sensing transcriptional regulator